LEQKDNEANEVEKRQELFGVTLSIRSMKITECRQLPKRGGGNLKPPQDTMLGCGTGNQKTDRGDRRYPGNAAKGHKKYKTPDNLYWGEKGDRHGQKKCTQGKKQTSEGKTLRELKDA